MHKRFIFKTASILFLLMCFQALTPLSQAQTVQSDTSVIKKRTLPMAYIHVGGGVALSWLTSSKIESLFEEDYGICRIGLPLSWSVRAGIWCIFQFEYRRGVTAHDFNKNEFTGGGYTGVETTATIEMDYDYEDRLLKFNPLFLFTKRNDEFNIVFFVVIGNGNVKYLDEVGDGFDGKSKIFGLELAGIDRYRNVSVSIKKYSIDFDPVGQITELIEPGRVFKASQWQIELNLALGLGY